MYDNTLYDETEQRRLLNNFNRRDADAFGRVYSIFYDDLCLFSNRIYANTEVLGSDVVHDIFINIWSTDKLKFEKLINIKAYVYTSIKNKFKNYITHSKCLDKYKHNVIIDPDYYMSQIIECETYSLISNLPDMLPQDCVEIIKLYLEGWEIKDIAEKLNKPQSSVYAKKQEAIKLLKKSVGKNYYFLIFYQLL